jgi:hypothetical protein
MWGPEHGYAPTRCVGHIYPRPAAYVNAKRKPNQRTRTISTKGDSSTCKCGLGARLCWFCTERAQSTYLNNQCRALPYSCLVARVPRQEEQGAGEGRGRRGRAGIGVGPVGSSAYDGELLTFASQSRELLFSQSNAISRFSESHCGGVG